MKQLKQIVCILISFISFVASAQNELPNGGFENWPDDFAPAGYGTFQAPQAQYAALRTVFKSPDARSGKFSVRLRNGSIKEAIAQMNINTYGVNFPDQIIPSGVWSCEGNCKVPPKDNLGRSRFPVTKRYKTLCGYYKGKLAGGDKIFISIVMFKGANIMGGSDAGTIQHAFVTESSTVWKKFEIPITYFGSADNVIPDAAALQISIVGKTYPQNAFAGGTGQFVTLGTEVLIDDVAFCVGKADVLVFTPKVLNERSPQSTTQDSVSAEGVENQSTGTNEQIPENEHLRPGAQTFVNMDNDDNDPFFDYEPEEDRNPDKYVNGGDDELIKIILRIPERTVLEALAARRQMSAKLEITKGKDNIRVWEHDTKDTVIIIPKTYNVYKDFKERSGEYLIREIWVEGISPHTRQMGTVIKFTHSEDPQFKDEFAITIIGIEKIEWIGRENSIKNKNELDPDPNQRNVSDHRSQLPGAECGSRPEQSTLKPEGVRMFPCRRVINGFVLDEKPRNIVDVKVTLSVKPVKPVKIYFKSFDVDDPTAAGVTIPPNNAPDYEYWVDNEKDNKDDNRGAVGEGPNKHAGKFPGEDPEGILEVEFADAEKTFPFEVTMQPGDNFRVAGSCDKDFIMSLRNDDTKLNIGGNPEMKNENKQRIINLHVLNAKIDYPDKAEVRMADKYASKTLSVWRFLNVEIDYMENVTQSTLSGRTTTIESNIPVAGQSKIYLPFNISLELEAKRITNVETNTVAGAGMVTGNGIKNAYQEGKITIELPGMGINRMSMTYDVLYNSGNENGNDYVIVRGVVPEQGAGQTFQLINDDESQGYKDGADLKTAIQGRIHVTDNAGKCRIANRYMDAYIVPDFHSINTSALNSTNTSPFVRNTKKYEDDDNALVENYRFDNQGFQRYEDFWTVYLLFAFKGCTYEDGDPDGGSRTESIPDTEKEPSISGITDKQRKGAHIFLDGNLERNGGVYQGSPGNGKGELDCIVHELSHLLGATHDDGGLLAFPEPQTQWFSPKTIGTIRSVKRPGLCCQ